MKKGKTQSERNNRNIVSKVQRFLNFYIYFKGRKCLRKKVLRFLPKSAKVSSVKSP